MDNREKTWHGVRAAGLSLVPGAGHLYLGEKKGWWIVAFSIGLFVICRTVWEPAELLYLSMIVFSAFDAFSIAKRGHGLM